MSNVVSIFEYVFRRNDFIIDFYPSLQNRLQVVSRRIGHEFTCDVINEGFTDLSLFNEPHEDICVGLNISQITVNYILWALCNISLRAIEFKFLE